MTTKMSKAMVVMVGGVGRLRIEGRHEGHHARNFRFLLLSLLLIVLAGGCYASIGPTIGYEVDDGLTLGAEIDSGAWLVHGGTGFLVHDARNRSDDSSNIVSVYGSIGPGFFAPAEGIKTVYFSAAGEIGAEYNRESKGSFVARLQGGPIIPVMRFSEATRDDPWRKIISLNCFLGFSYIDGEAWFHLSPQIGITGIPRFY